MSTVMSLPLAPAFRLGKLRDLLEVLAAVRRIPWPLDSANGLRQAVQALAEIGELLGLEPRWTARLRSILDDEAVFEVVLAIVRYVSRQFADDNGPRAAATSTEPTTLAVGAQSFADWLPVVLQLVELLRSLRR